MYKCLKNVKDKNTFLTLKIMKNVKNALKNYLLLTRVFLRKNMLLLFHQVQNNQYIFLILLYIYTNLCSIT